MASVLKRVASLAPACALVAQTALAAQSLQPHVFPPLPLGSIKPTGWLSDQLNLAKDGLAGHEYVFYVWVQNSTWIGGDQEYGGTPSLREGLPYWFNGLVPLAYGLGDDGLIGQVKDAKDYILQRQTDDGWIGPETGEDVSVSALWARMPFFLGLMNMADADPSTTDEIVAALNKYLPKMNDLLKNGTPDDNTQWGKARYADMMIVLQWLYEKHPGSNPEQYLDAMSSWQSFGLDWASYYTSENYLSADINSIDPKVAEDYFPYLHGVNVGQGLKTMAVDYRVTGEEGLLQTQRDAVNWTFFYHGAASGTIIGDEREAGLQPWHGSEFCTTVETMFSLTSLYHITGEPDYADRAELAAFNAQPAHLSPDHWVHNYILSTNEPWAYQNFDSNPNLWWNVNKDAESYAVDPNYPCCAVNHFQGNSKFLAASYALSGDNGLAHTILVPASANTTLGDGKTQVQVKCDTSYPFTSVLQYSINASDSFTFSVRVPTWKQTTPAKLSLNGNDVSTNDPDEHGMISAKIPAGDSTLVYTLSPDVYVENRANSSIAIHRGPLLYALDIGQHNTTIPPLGNAPNPQAQSYWYNNTKPWNYALDPNSLKYHGPDASAVTVDLDEKTWDYQVPPGSITVDGCQIDWPLFYGMPDSVPLAGKRGCTADKETLVMRPFGSLRSRMAEFPTIET